MTMRTVWVAGCGAVLLLTGCGVSDPAALPDWATAASRAVEYRPAGEQFAPTPNQDPPRRAASRPRQVPFGLTPPPAAEPPPPPENRAAMRAAQAGTVLALQAVAASWLDTLAQRASGIVLAPRERPFAIAQAQIARTDAAAATRVGSLGAVLERAGSADVPRLIEAGHAPFMAVMSALRDTTVRLAGAETEEREAILLQSERLVRQARGAGARQEAQDARDARLTEQSGRGNARQAYVGVVERIMETHRLLWDRRDELSRDETMTALRRAEGSLRRAAAALPR